MQNTTVTPGSRNPIDTGKQTLLPPKSPGSTMPTSYIDFNAGSSVGTIGTPKPREGYRHQRTSSESNLIEEQPSWLDDLLNEPETPVRNGTHRRASSDSFAYMDTYNFSSYLDNVTLEGFNHHNLMSQPSSAPEDFDHLRGLQHHHSIESNSFGMHQSRGKDLNLNAVNYRGSNHQSGKNKAMVSDPLSTTKDSTEQNQNESARDVNGSSEKGESSHARQTQSEIETKRVKQQFAQRSRVRKLQYIAELERTLQSLQAEGMGISAEIEFVGQQNLILSMENKALKQRFDSLSQEHLIKCFEQEMFEREIGRLRAFFHHQHQQHQHQLLQQPPPPPPPQQQRQQQRPNSNHARSNSRDLDLQLSNLSLKHKDANSGRDPGPLHI